jgi:hypothetical protein
MSPRFPRHVTPLPIPISTITRVPPTLPRRAFGTVPPEDLPTARVTPLPFRTRSRAVTVLLVALAALAVAGVIALL